MLRGNLAKDSGQGDLAKDTGQGTWPTKMDGSEAGEGERFQVHLVEGSRLNSRGRRREK